MLNISSSNDTGLVNTTSAESSSNFAQEGSLTNKACFAMGVVFAVAVADAFCDGIIDWCAVKEAGADFFEEAWPRVGEVASEDGEGETVVLVVASCGVSVDDFS